MGLVFSGICIGAATGACMLAKPTGFAPGATYCGMFGAGAKRGLDMVGR